MTVVSNSLNAVNIRKAKRFKNLTMFPLASESPTEPDYVTLAVAVEEGLCVVREVSEAGSVPELLLHNRAEIPVLIVDGEELVGAKQNRTANLSVLAPPKSETVIPVSCVEAGRWRTESHEFEVSERAQYARGRAVKMASVSHSIGHGGTRRSDQGRVWADIDRAACELGADSPTRAMAAIFDRHRTRIEDYVEALPAERHQVGAMFAIGSVVVGMDLFDHSSTWKAMTAKLVRSYALDALGERRTDDRKPGRKRALSFLTDVAEGDFEEYPGVGLGVDIRLSQDKFVAGGLVHNDRLVHLAAFHAPDPSPRSAPSRGAAMASFHRRRDHLRR